MTEKACIKCKELIHYEASRCPKCQSFQSKWRGPVVAAVFLLLILPLTLVPAFLTWRSSQIDYVDYQHDISSTVVSIDTIQPKLDCQPRHLNILVETDNQSDQEWENAKFVVSFRDQDGDIVNVEKSNDYQLVLRPRTTATTSIKVPIYEEYEKTAVEVELVDLRYSRF